MDPGLLIMLAVYSVPVLIGIGVPTVGRLRRRARRKALAEWARERGLTQDESGTWRGTVGEQRLKLAFDGSNQLVISLLVRPALDLGLTVLPSNWNAPWGLAPVATGDAHFDYALRAYGAEEFRVRQLLSLQLRSSLSELLPHVVGLRLTDASLELWLAGSAAMGPTVPQLLDRTQPVMSEIERQRAKMPAARELAPFLDAWQRFAAEHDLLLSRAPLGLRGTLRGRDVWAVAVRTSSGRETSTSHLLDVLAWFDPPLSIALSLRSKDDAVRAPGPVGTGGFAEAFELDADDERTASLLDSRLQRELLRMHQRRGAVELTSGWLWVRIPALPADPAAALEAMEDVAELGHAVTLAARAVASGGGVPYRTRQ